MPGGRNPLFEKDVQLGNLAVKKVYAELKRRGYAPRVAGKKGYDLILKDGRKVEVKFDVVMDRTGNVACEWWSDRKNSSPGWMQYSDADILIQFHDMDNAVVLDMQKLISWVTQNFDAFRMANSKYSQAELLLIPARQVPEGIKVPEFGGMFQRDYGISDKTLQAIRGGYPPGALE